MATHNATAAANACPAPRFGIDIDNPDETGRRPCVAAPV
jgi:hypothetical protein